MKSSCTIAILLTSMTCMFGQVSGNSGYGDNYGYGKQPSAEKCYLTDSTFLVEASVAINVQADIYVATIGLAEEGTTLRDANEKIEKRIQGFINDLVKKGFDRTGIHVDMTAQNKIYDYHTTDNTAEQYLKGFEIKKNVIVRFQAIRELDDILLMASNYQIFDLVKVDYIVSDLAAIHTRLFQSAMEIIEQKKGMYTAAMKVALLPGAEIYQDQFYSFYPEQLYKSYTAYESSEVYNEYDQYTRKDIRKSATIYYDKINYSGFDKIINPAVIEPAVEFVLTLAMKYEILR